MNSKGFKNFHNQFNKGAANFGSSPRSFLGIIGALSLGYLLK